MTFTLRADLSAVITLDSKRTISYSIGAMTFVSLNFLAGLLYLTFFVTNQVSAKPIEIKECNKKMEAMLKEIEKRLAHMKTDINILKGNQNPKGKLEK